MISWNKPELSEQEQVDRAQVLENFIQNNYVIAAFEAVKESIISDIGNVARDDKEAHQSLVIALQQLARVKANIVSHITTGYLIQENRRVKQNWRNEVA